MQKNDNLEKEIEFLRSLGKHSRRIETWNGDMRCRSCFYGWKSRRNSPPARCPKCNSTNLEAVNNISYY